MRTRRAAALRSLRMMLTASVLFPLLLFGYASWANYRAAFERADDQIRQALDLSAEHALRVFRSITVTFDSVEQITRGRTERTLRANAAELSERLKQFVSALPDIGSVWILNAEGDAIVSSLFFPLPPAANAPERAWLRSQLANDASLHIGDVLRIQPTGETDFSGQQMADGQFRNIFRDYRDFGLARRLRTVLRTTGRTHQRELWADQGRRRGAGALPGADHRRHQARCLDRLQPIGRAQPARRPVHVGFRRGRDRTALCRAQARGIPALRHVQPGDAGYRAGLAVAHGELPGVRNSRDRVLCGADPAGDAKDRRVLCRSRTAGSGRGQPAPGAEDGGGRAIDRRRRARLQQSPHHHPRQSGTGAASMRRKAGSSGC